MFVLQAIQVPNCPDPPRRRRSHKEVDTSSGTSNIHIDYPDLFICLFVSVKGQVETEFIIPSDLVQNDNQSDNYAIVEVSLLIFV